MANEASSSGFSSDGLDDVEDFVWMNEGESSMSWELFSHLYDVMQMGNRAFRDCRFEEAINCYSRAHNIKPSDPVILSNRCAAYLRISQFLKYRPSSDSEYRPLSGLDPTTHAGLALEDAEKVMNFRSNLVTSYILKANALILDVQLINGKSRKNGTRMIYKGGIDYGKMRELEKYELAHDVVLSGLQVDPLSNPLQNLVRITAGTIGKRNRVKPQRTDDFDCTICLKLLYKPITTPCGHSFCWSCLFQSMDQGNRCPLCRTVLFISPRTYAISVTLNSIIQKNFPEEYAERKLEHDSLTNLGADFMPLFGLYVVLPCQKFQLNIVEARYRLMVRRIMEGNHRMVMVIIDSTTDSVPEYACEVEITDCEPLPDGRFFLQVESRRRCHILRNWDQDGYRVAEVEWVQDICPPEGTRERVDLQEMINKIAAYARSWMREAQAAAQGDEDRLARLFIAEGLMPTTQDPERFSFWLATLTNPRPSPSERLDLLRIRDTKERMRRGLRYMKAEEQRRGLH